MPIEKNENLFTFKAKAPNTRYLRRLRAKKRLKHGDVINSAISAMRRKRVATTDKLKPIKSKIKNTPKETKANE